MFLLFKRINLKFFLKLNIDKEATIKEKNEHIVGERNVKLEGYGSLLSDNEINAQSCFKICESMPECKAVTFHDFDLNKNETDSQNEQALEKSCVLFEADLFALVENNDWISYIKKD